VINEAEISGYKMCYNMHYGVTYDGFCTRATEGKSMEGRIAVALKKTFLSKQGKVVSPFGEYFETNFVFTYICTAVLMSKHFNSQLDDNRHFTDGNIIFCVCVCV